MTIRVGIVGTGGISRAHHRAYTSSQVVSRSSRVCDIVKSKANEAR